MINILISALILLALAYFAITHLSPGEETDSGRSAPAYAQYVAEGAVLMAPAKAALTASYSVAGAMPADAAAAGLSSPQAYSTDTVQGITYARLSDTAATLTISYKAMGDAVPQGATIVYTATGASGRISWSCKGGTMPNKYKPADCRG